MRAALAARMALSALLIIETGLVLTGYFVDDPALFWSIGTFLGAAGAYVGGNVAHNLVQAEEVIAHLRAQRPPPARP